MRAVLAAVLATVTLAGCMGSDSGRQSVPGGGDVRIAVPVRLSNCRDWQDASLRERLGTVRQLRDFAGGPSGSPGGHGTVIDDDKAYDLLESYCKNEFARGFKLYKVYTRASAFGNQR